MDDYDEDDSSDSDGIIMKKKKQEKVLTKHKGLSSGISKTEKIEEEKTKIEDNSSKGLTEKDYPKTEKVDIKKKKIKYADQSSSEESD